MIGSHFKQWLEHSKTPFFKYFSLIAKKKMDFFEPQGISSSVMSDSQANSKSKVYDELFDQLGLDEGKLKKLKELQPEFERLNRRFENHEHELKKMCKSVCKVSNSIDDVINSILKQIPLEVIQKFYNLFTQVRKNMFLAQT